MPFIPRVSAWVVPSLALFREFRQGVWWICIFPVPHIIILPFTFLIQRTWKCVCDSITATEHDTGATSQFSSGSVCAANPSPLMLELFILWNGPLCTHVSLWSRLWSEHRAQSFWLGQIYLGLGIRVGLASWAHFGVTYGACAHRNCDNWFLALKICLLLLSFFLFPGGNHC